MGKLSHSACGVLRQVVSALAAGLVEEPLLITSTIILEGNDFIANAICEFEPAITMSDINSPRSSRRTLRREV